MRNRGSVSVNGEHSLKDIKICNIFKKDTVFSKRLSRNLHESGRDCLLGHAKDIC
jgi:hypothetical protein